MRQSRACLIVTRPMMFYAPASARNWRSNLHTACITCVWKFAIDPFSFQLFSAAFLYIPCHVSGFWVRILKVPIYNPTTWNMFLLSPCFPREALISDLTFWWQGRPGCLKGFTVVSKCILTAFLTFVKPVEKMLYGISEEKIVTKEVKLEVNFKMKWYIQHLVNLRINVIS